MKSLVFFLNGYRYCQHNSDAWVQSSQLQINLKIWSKKGLKKPAVVLGE